MYISVCVGSACHIKGSYQVIKRMKAFISENGLENRIDLKSSFCLGQCGEAVSVSINGARVVSLAPDDTEMFMKTLIESGEANEIY